MLAHYFLGTIVPLVMATPLFNNPPPAGSFTPVPETSEKSPSIKHMQDAVAYFRGIGGQTCGNSVPDGFIAGGCTLSWGSKDDVSDGGGRVYICGFHSDSIPDSQCNVVADALQRMIDYPACVKTIAGVQRVGGQVMIRDMTAAVGDTNTQALNMNQVYLTVAQEGGPS